jgi:hypothetical protein
MHMSMQVLFPQTCVQVSRTLLPFSFLTWIRAKLFQRFYSIRRSTSRSGLSLLCAHRVARHAPGVDKAGGVEHACAAVERAVQAVGVHHVGHHRPHPVPAVLAEHLHLPQLVQVLCQQHTDTSQISRTKLHMGIVVANRFIYNSFRIIVIKQQKQNLSSSCYIFSPLVRTS